MATDNTGTTNSPYDAITIETIAGEIQAAPLNTSLGNLDTAVQSHAHPLDGAVGWDSLKADLAVIDGVDQSNRWAMVCGTKNITTTGGYGTVTITFASDADQGDPSFTTAPRVVATVFSSSGKYNLRISVASTTATTVQANELDGGSGATTLGCYWMAYGKVA